LFSEISGQALSVDLLTLVFLQKKGSYAWKFNAVETMIFTFADAWTDRSKYFAAST
jgi:hypothetical protein